MIDKHGVQGMLELIFTNKFKNTLLWSVTSTLVFFLPLLARGAHSQHNIIHRLFNILSTAQERKKMLKQIHK